ncbi:TPA: cell surface protein, partial [Streptococcus pneumoniae]|nr:cell surface protein [Streptococcus pneumoniae]HEV3843574.1 cell surface protein [Streptococcus pneumoniae]
ELEKLLDSLDPEGKTQDELDKEAAEAELDKKVEALQNKVADLEKEISNLEILLGGADSEDDTAALQNKLATKKAELEKTQKELDAALNELGPDGDEEETPAPAP